MEETTVSAVKTLETLGLPVPKTLSVARAGAAEVTAAAEVVVQYEQEFVDKPPRAVLCEDIPEWRRVHTESFDGYYLASQRRNVMLHFKTRANGTDGEWNDFRQEVKW